MNSKQCCLDFFSREAVGTAVGARRISGTTEETRVSGVLFSPALKEGSDDVEKEDDVDQSEDEVDHDEDEDDVFNPYLFIAGLPPHSSVVIKDKICLPPLPKNGISRPTLALDLDETLVHCTVEPIAKPDLTFVVTFNGTMYQVYVRKRPYLDYFLDIVSKSFEVTSHSCPEQLNSLITYCTIACGTDRSTSSHLSSRPLSPYPMPCRSLSSQPRRRFMLTFYWTS